MTTMNTRTDKFLIAFADALDDRALKLNENAELHGGLLTEDGNEDEAAEYIWTCATAGTVAMLISAAIRDVVKGGGRASPGIH